MLRSWYNRAVRTANRLQRDMGSIRVKPIEVVLKEMKLTTIENTMARRRTLFAHTLMTGSDIDGRQALIDEMLRKGNWAKQLTRDLAIIDVPFSSLTTIDENDLLEKIEGAWGFSDSDS